MNSFTNPDNLKFRLYASALFAFIMGFWIYLVRGFLFDPSALLPRDSLGWHLPAFQYVVDYLRRFSELPPWFLTTEGGVWTDIVTNNLLLIAPHRMLGYLLSAASGIDTVIGYKIAVLVFGFGIFWGGIFLVALHVLKSPLEATLILALSMTAGCGVGILHQEQALGTAQLIPLTWWLLLKATKQTSFLVFAAALVGLSMNVHYPQIAIIYWLWVIVSFFALSPDSRKWMLLLFKKENWPTLGLCLVAFLVSASPVLHSYVRYHDQVVSPFRSQLHSVEAIGYSEYLEFNRLQLSSLNPLSLWRYAGKIHPKEQMATFDGNVVWIGNIIWALIWFPLARIRSKFALALITVGLGVSAVGIFSFAPHFYWYFIPGLRLFRQWYHFLPVLDLNLLALSYLCARDFLQRLKWPKLEYPLAVAIGAVLLAQNMNWAKAKIDEYLAKGAFREGRSLLHGPSWIAGFTDGKSPFEGQFLATPKGIDSKFIHDQIAKGGPFLIQEGDSWKPLPVKLVSGTKNLEFTVNEPLLAQAQISFLQADDDKWHIRINSQPVITQRNSSGTLSFSSPPSMTTIQISRDASGWKYLVMLSYLTILLSGIWSFKMQAKASA